MYRAVLVLAASLVLLAAPIAAQDTDQIDDESFGDGEHVLTLEETVEDDDYTLFEDEELVQYPYAYTREATSDGEYVERAIYENTSLDDWIDTQARSAAHGAVEDRIIDEYGEPAGLGIGVTADGVRVTYFEYTDEDREPERSYTADDLVALLPEHIEATIHFDGYTDATRVPVTVESEAAPQHDLGELDDTQTEDRDDGYDQPQPADDHSTTGDTEVREDSFLDRILTVLRSLVPF